MAIEMQLKRGPIGIMTHSSGSTTVDHIGSRGAGEVRVSDFRDPSQREHSTEAFVTVQLRELREGATYVTALYLSPAQLADLKAQLSALSDPDVLLCGECGGPMVLPRHSADLGCAVCGALAPDADDF